jgi:hypothetical protein
LPAAASDQISHCMPVIGTDGSVVPSAHMGNSSICSWTDFLRATSSGIGVVMCAIAPS